MEQVRRVVGWNDPCTDLAGHIILIAWIILHLHVSYLR